MVEPERRWLDGGVWSCRIKLPQLQTNRLQPASIANDDESCPTSRAPVMDLPLETTSPRRNNIADALQNMPSMNHHIDALDAPLDPDAQATVSDFLDFTDYLPSDTIRSLTLVGNLDGTHREACVSLNELTKTYGQLPSLPADGKPKPLKLRADISSTVTESVRARSLATAEASRMAENADRHLARARNIYAKLQEIRDHYPTSREPSPELQKGSKSPQLSRAPKPKITLRLDGSARPAADQNVPKVRHHRAPRITVPGEVLAPYELDYESYGSETGESSDDDRISSRATPGRSLAGGTIKLKIKDKAPKQKIPKPPRPPRPLGMGTNVHSAVAGISTSNALAKLKPPPENAVLGSSDAPWLQLTAYELAKLRKRMKKNAVWSPSDTMISRELKNLGRGIEAYRAAKIKADAAGEPITHSIQPLVDGDDGTRVYQEGAISTEALEKEEVQLSNRGMKLNEAKKLKRENQAKELAKQAAEEAEESAHKMAKAAQAVKDLFSNAEPAEEKKTPAKTPKKAAPKKRKREADVESHVEKIEADTPKPVIPYAKRNKTETPIPVPQPIIAALESAPSTSSETAPPSVTDSTHIPPTPSSPKKSSTPILPPGTVKKDVKKEVKKPQPIRTSNRQSSAAPTPTPVSEPLPAKRPTSARAAVSRPTSRGKAASVEPASTVAKDRPRRASTAHNTPAPEIRTPANRRTKRPAPGIVTGGAGIEGPKAISKRAAAPKKKNSKKRKDDKSGVIEEDQVEVDDEGNVIDPDEPRYCVCNRVSFGTMIGCESADCEKEWFHLECVGLTDIPSRTTKWYCPDCRVRLGLGEKGEITARGKKK